jgi:hypothetical protein
MVCRVATGGGQSRFTGRMCMGQSSRCHVRRFVMKARPGPPLRCAELKAMIATRRVVLPLQMELVARLALERPEVVAFGTITSIATATSVSPTTVVPAAHILGFASFRELRSFLREAPEGKHLAPVVQCGGGDRACHCIRSILPRAPIVRTRNVSQNDHHRRGHHGCRSCSDRFWGASRRDPPSGLRCLK